MAIVLTERAAKEVKKIMEEQKLPETVVLRVGVQGGGCSGFSYALGFDNEVNPMMDDVAESWYTRMPCATTASVETKSSMIIRHFFILFFGHAQNMPRKIAEKLSD